MLPTDQGTPEILGHRGASKLTTSARCLLCVGYGALHVLIRYAPGIKKNRALVRTFLQILGQRAEVEKLCVRACVCERKDGE